MRARQKAAQPTPNIIKTLDGVKSCVLLLLVFTRVIARVTAVKLREMI